MDDKERDTAGLTSLWPPGRRWRSAGGDVLPAPFIADSAPPGALVWLMEELLLEAVARDALGDQAAAGRAIERAVDLAEPDHMLYPRAHRCLRCCPRERRNRQPSLVKHPLLTRGRSRGYQLSPATYPPAVYDDDASCDLRSGPAVARKRIGHPHAVFKRFSPETTAQCDRLRCLICRNSGVFCAPMWRCGLPAGMSCMNGGGGSGWTAAR